MKGKCEACKKETSMRIQVEGCDEWKYVCPKCFDGFLLALSELKNKKR